MDLDKKIKEILEQEVNVGSKVTPKSRETAEEAMHKLVQEAIDNNEPWTCTDPKLYSIMGSKSSGKIQSWTDTKIQCEYCDKMPTKRVYYVMAFQVKELLLCNEHFKIFAIENKNSYNK